MNWNDTFVYIAFWWFVFDVRKLADVIRARHDQAKMQTFDISANIAITILIASCFLGAGNFPAFALFSGSIVVLSLARLLIWRRKRMILRAWR